MNVRDKGNKKKKEKERQEYDISQQVSVVSVANWSENSQVGKGGSFMHEDKIF